MIPSFEEFLFPVLFALMDGKPLYRDDLRDACVKNMGFTEEELKERISSGKKYKIVDRLQWATYYLQKAGLVFRPSHATDQITDEGKALLETGVTNINRQYLREHFEAYRVFEKQTRDAAKRRLQEKKKELPKKGRRKTSTQKVATENNTKEELPQPKGLFDDINMNTVEKFSVEFKPSTLENTIQKISDDCERLNNELVAELKSIINEFDQESFAALLLELIPRMGYSSVFRECQLSAKMAHDVVLSGFFNIDELGLNRFFLLAHNNTEDEISLIDVQSFIGALSSIGISTGVYITTSRFSSEAMEYQTHGAIRCILIDGEMLAKLMIKFNIGVVTRKVYEIKDVDQEYLFTRLTQS